MIPQGRTRKLVPSPIRALAELADDDVVSLGLGEPGWPLHAAAAAALARVAARSCRYGPNEGLPELRAAIARHHGVDKNRVAVTTGSQGALFALMQAWVGPRDEVLLPNPGFVAYPTLARFVGGRPHAYALDADGRLDAERFARVLAGLRRPRLAIINHPANPTGAGASPESLRAVAMACARTGTLLVADEVYRDLYLGPRPAGLLESGGDGVVLGSLSKAWAAPGLRIGWAIGEPALLEPLRRVHAAMVSTPARPSQLAGTALLEASAAVLAHSRAELSRRWQAYADACAAFLHRRPTPPDGGLYHWLELPAAGRVDPLGFGRRLCTEAKVIVIPGVVFGSAGAGHVRVGLGGTPEEIRRGVERLAPFWRAP